MLLLPYVPFAINRRKLHGAPAKKGVEDLRKNKAERRLREGRGRAVMPTGRSYRVSLERSRRERLGRENDRFKRGVFTYTIATKAACLRTRPLQTRRVYALGRYKRGVFTCSVH